MNNAIKNKFLTWLVVTLLVANAGTILFFWINRPERMQGEKGSPREFLVHELELDSSQLIAFQDLIEGHQASARSLKKEIRTAKENLFQLLKQPVIPEPEKMKAVQAITLKIQGLELLNLEHFQKLRALCNDKQKIKFDGLLDQLAGLMAASRVPQGAPPGAVDHHLLPASAADSSGKHPSAIDQHRPPPPAEGHRPPPPPGEGHPPPPGEGHRPPPPPGEGHPPPPGEGHHPKQGEGHPPLGGKRPLPPPDQQ
jgi:hypothetical protein